MGAANPEELLEHLMQADEFGVKLLDLLSARLLFERTGVRLYDSIIRKIERGAESRYGVLVGTLREHRDEARQRVDQRSAVFVTAGVQEVVAVEEIERRVSHALRRAAAVPRTAPRRLRRLR